MSIAFYNEIDPYAAQWLRNLIAAGHIADGIVDERDIRDIRPDELSGFTQCHFFAGIGLWSLALRQAGWPDDRPAWTGSCPCQPFSAAGRGKGTADERHLWPAFFHHIDAIRPAVVMGEQVASADGLAWLDLVSDDLEGAGYAVRAADTCAAGIGAPHIRQRLYWLADAECRAAERRGLHMADATSSVEGEARERQRIRDDAWPGGATGRLGHAMHTGLAVGSLADISGGVVRDKGAASSAPGALCDAWGANEWLACTDGKHRPAEPGTFPLADGHPARMGKLRAYGNAIVPQVAAEIIGAYLDMRAAA